MPSITTCPERFRDLLEDWDLAMRAAGKKPKTISIYTDAAAWLAERLPAKIGGWQAVTRKHIREHMAWLGSKYSPAYASNQYRALQQWFKWLAAEEDIPNPMDGMSPPAVPPKLVPVFKNGEVAALLAACKGRDFTAVRDRALIHLFASSGARLAEIASLKVTDVDLPQQCAIVVGKGSRPRVIRFNDDTTLALQRYLRARKRYDASKDGPLWVGQRGPLHPNAVYLMFKRRAEKAGLAGINPHRFRHDFAHRWLANGGQETDLQQQAGWSSTAMLARYGASAAAERSRAAYDRVMGRAS